MITWMFLSVCILITIFLFVWITNNRKYESKQTVSSAYDSWTNDRLLEELWGEHIHLGYYGTKKNNFRSAKIEFVHRMASWSGLDKLPAGSKILDVGCGIGGSARILARDYGFDVIGITVSSAQVKRAKQLTRDDISCRFEVMDALDLQFNDATFDGVWSVEAGPHMPNKQRFADEMLRVMRPKGVLAVADWNQKDFFNNRKSLFEHLVLRQLLSQWAHPEFSSISGFRKNLVSSQYCKGSIDDDDWTKFTLPSWHDSILEGFRRPKVFIKLGPFALFNGLREIPTFLLMRWAFRNGLMQFGVFRSSD